MWKGSSENDASVKKKTPQNELKGKKTDRKMSAKRAIQLC